MILAAFDPGLTRTGWAVRDEHNYINAGVIVPPKKGLLWDRLDVLSAEVYMVLKEFRPHTVVLEWGSGHVDHKRHMGGGAGLSSYGAACDTVYRAARSYRDNVGALCIEPTDEHWCRRIPKEVRPALAVDLFPAYAGMEDRGTDIADAVLIANWWWKECLVSHGR